MQTLLGGFTAALARWWHRYRATLSLSAESGYRHVPKAALDHGATQLVRVYRANKGDVNKQFQKESQALAALGWRAGTPAYAGSRRGRTCTVVYSR